MIVKEKSIISAQQKRKACARIRGELSWLLALHLYKMRNIAIAFALSAIFLAFLQSVYDKYQHDPGGFAPNG